MQKVLKNFFKWYIINECSYNISDCCCEAALYKYSSPGVVPLGSGDVVWTTNYWARQFKVEFDIKVRVDSVLPLFAWAG